MPQFKDKPAEGLCERMGLECKYPDHYTDLANSFGAEPVKIEGSITIDGKPAKWSYWGLQLPEGNLAMAKKRMRPYLELRLTEFPCWMECPVVVAKRVLGESRDNG